MFLIKKSFSILDEIIDKIPLVAFNWHAVKILKHVVLAGPAYHVPQSIDLLLGAGVFWDLIYAEQIRSAKNQPILQKMKMVWIIGDPYAIGIHQTTAREFYGVSDTRNLQNQRQHFWKIEVLRTAEALSHEESFCDKNFQQTYESTFRKIRRSTFLSKWS